MMDSAPVEILQVEVSGYAGTVDLLNQLILLQQPVIGIANEPTRIQLMAQNAQAFTITTILVIVS